MASARRRSRGFTLMEVLVALLLFSLALVAMTGLQGTAIQLTSDAQQRAEAAFLADQLLARLLVADPAGAAGFAHRADGKACAPTGADTTHAVVKEWLVEVQEALPRAAPEAQQVVVTTSGGVTDVTVTLCWKNQDADEPHTLAVSNRLQWQ